MVHKLRIALAPLALLALLAGPASAEEWTEPAEFPDPAMKTYRVRVGDTLDVTFFNSPNMNQSRQVGPDGQIFLALIGSLDVAGRTLAELTDELVARYETEMVEPMITVNVREFSGMLVYVGGEVEQPGTVPYRGGLTALQAVMHAGGFKDTAKKKKVILIRPDDRGEPVGTVINLKQVLADANLRNDRLLAPSDVLFIPRTNVANVNKFMKQYFRDNSPLPPGFGFVFDVND